MNKLFLILTVLAVSFFSSCEKGSVVDFLEQTVWEYETSDCPQLDFGTLAFLDNNKVEWITHSGITQKGTYTIINDHFVSFNLSFPEEKGYFQFIDAAVDVSRMYVKASSSSNGLPYIPADTPFTITFKKK